MFAELRIFKDREGHCNVPSSYTSNPELYHWVGHQRRKRVTMSKERASELESIGFTWGIKLDLRWNLMFDELERYKDREGHCNVPCSYPENPKLYRWVGHQRRTSVAMSKERSSKLNSIGFNWGRQPDVKGKSI